MTKNKSPHQVPLLPTVIDIIKAQPRFEDCDYVFSSYGKSFISGWSKTKNNIISSLKSKKLVIDNWRIHDLRRTVASNLGDLGFMDSGIGLLLNHQSRSVTSIYNRSSYLTKKIEMLEKWFQQLNRILEAST